MAPSMYPKLLESRKFRTRAEAEAFADKLKEEYKLSAGMSLKKDIKFNNETKEWTAMIYVRMPV